MTSNSFIPSGFQLSANYPKDIRLAVMTIFSCRHHCDQTDKSNVNSSCVVNNDITLYEAKKKTQSKQQLQVILRRLQKSCICWAWIASSWVTYWPTQSFPAGSLVAGSFLKQPALFPGRIWIWVKADFVLLMWFLKGRSTGSTLHPVGRGATSRDDATS